MNIIRPATIAEADLFGTNIPEDDETEYNPATTYGDGDRCMVAADHKVYESLQAANTGNTPSTSPTWWLEIGATNRWKPFDQRVQDQASQAESLTIIIEPGLVDSISFHNLDAADLQVIQADQDTNLVTNGEDWTGATGSTPPTGWINNGTTTYLIDSGALKLTAGSDHCGPYQDATVTPGTEMQFIGKYRNTNGDTAEIFVYDNTHAAFILDLTDLEDSQVESVFSEVFTVPAGCTSLRFGVYAKNNGDIVWFDSVRLSEVSYNESVDLIDTIAILDWYTYFYEPIVRPTDIVRTDLAVIGAPPIGNCSMTIIINNEGGNAEVGEIVVGLKFNLGALQYGASAGIEDYSTKEVDDAGINFIIEEKGYSKRLQGYLEVKNTIRAEVNRQLTLYRAKPLVFVGSEGAQDSDLILYGFFKRFDPVIREPAVTIMALEAISLT